jgi:hypothetical protein
MSIPLLFLLMTCLLSLDHLHAQRHVGISLESQQTALLDWKSTLWGNLPLQMSSWERRTSPCNWTGIACIAARHGKSTRWHVTNISLPGADIHGQLGELNFSALPFLAYIDLNTNSLHGTIPANIVPSLPRLSYLNLNSNWLTGPIPKEIGELESLTRLDLQQQFERTHPCIIRKYDSSIPSKSAS